ncbi:MAG: GumC family protein [Terriglobia bacterium]
METYSIQRYEARRSPEVLREILAILFRHRRLFLMAFTATFAGALIAVLVFGIRYEAETSILVRHQRADNTVSAEADARDVSGLPTDREINSEVALLQSDDLLRETAHKSGLDASSDHFWSPWLAAWQTPEERTAKAARRLKDHLHVMPVPQSNMIKVSYVSRDPEQAARVLKNLNDLYVAKHVSVNRPPGVFGFFEDEAHNNANQLRQAEGRLADFIRTENAVAPTVARDLLLKKASDFEGMWAQTQSDIAEAAKRAQALEEQRAQVPQRQRTVESSSDNPQLLANLKSTLANLEVRRAELTKNYAPTYRLVQQVDEQIADVRNMIAQEEKSPIRQETTDSNPTYLMLDQELSKTRAELKSLHAKAAAMAPMAATYGRQALHFDQQNIQLQDLVRNVKLAEDNFLLYSRKQEEARISDALDSRRILNIAIAETPSVPPVPTSSPLIMTMAGILLALMVGVGAAFTAEHLDASFRTPDEVIRCLNVPVLAVLPSAVHDPMFALLPANGHGNGNGLGAHKVGGQNGSSKLLGIWRQGNNGH